MFYPIPVHLGSMYSPLPLPPAFHFPSVLVVLRNFLLI